MTTDRMLQFVRTDKAMPEKRKADAQKDFDEIYAEFADAKAKEQASRCSNVVCLSVRQLPANNIPDWLMLTAEGRMEEAWEVSSATNSMPDLWPYLPARSSVKGIASLKKDLSLSPSALLKSILPKPPLKMAGCRPSLFMNDELLLLSGPVLPVCCR